MFPGVVRQYPIFIPRYLIINDLIPYLSVLPIMNQDAGVFMVILSQDGVLGRDTDFLQAFP
jgi:hypothetical protein